VIERSYPYSISLTTWVNYRALGGGLAVSAIWEEKLSRKGAIAPVFFRRLLVEGLPECRNVGPVGGSKLPWLLA